MNIHTPVPTIYGSHYEKFEKLWQSQIEKTKSKFGKDIESVLFPQIDLVEVPVLFVKKESIIDVLKFFKEDNEFQYGFLSDITAIDETPDVKRFHIVYNLFSHSNLNRIRLKVKLKESEAIETATVLWEAANWLEREVWDMFGVKFDNHPDLRRILMDERWEGHPLRKDYPLRKYQTFLTPMEPQAELLK